MSEATFRRRRTRPFTQIDDGMIKDKRLSIQALGLGVRMLCLDPDKVYSAKYIQAIAGVSRAKLKSLFDELIAAGYLQKEQTHGEHGKFSRNSYEIVDIPQIPPLTEKPSTVEPSTAEPSTGLCATDTISNDNNIPPIIPQRGKRGRKKAKKAEEPWLPERFEAFWQFYRDKYCVADHSRAGNKGRAETAWNKLKPDKALIGRMGAYLLAEMATETWARGIGIPYASTFLNSIAKGELDLTPAEASPTHPAVPAASTYEEPQEEAFGQWH